MQEFTLGPWRVDPLGRTLTHRQDDARPPVRLSNKANRVLLTLAEAAGRVVTRESLLNEVWPGVVVGEEVLTHAIAELRRALGDTARAPSFVETVHKAGYRLLAPVAAASSDDMHPPSSRPSIAVLPFDNLSGDPEQTYFSDGLAEDLITALTHWRSISVIARNSSFTYRRKAGNVVQIARELGASYVLEGSVRKAHTRIRVSVQLIDGLSGHHVWAERYDRDLGDVFDLQDELTSRIAAILVPELSRVELQRSVSKRPSDLGAWDCYLRGEAALAKLTPSGNAEARARFKRAIELDPYYSDAYSGLAHSYNRDVLLQCTNDKEKTLEQAIEAAKRAVELDPESAAAHHELSTSYIWRNRHDLALEEAHIAVKLNPNDAVGLHMLGNKSDLAGDPKGIERMEQAQQLNRRDPQIHVHLSFLARAYVNLRQYQKAIEKAHASIRRRQDYPNAHFILAVALAHCDRLAEAGQALDVCERLAPGFVEERSDWRPYTDENSNLHIHEGLRKILNHRSVI